jgi:hypothetical protein
MHAPRTFKAEVTEKEFNQHFKEKVVADVFINKNSSVAAPTHLPPPKKNCAYTCMINYVAVMKFTNKLFTIGT